MGDIDIDLLPPRAVCNIVKDAVGLWLWKREVANHAELALVAPAPLLQPLSKLVDIGKRGDDWQPLHMGCLKAAVVDGLWPQARLHREGMAGSGLCQACFGAWGSGAHRLYGCPTSDSFRTQHGHDDLFKQQAATSDLRALLPDPALGLPRRC